MFHIRNVSEMTPVLQAFFGAYTIFKALRKPLKADEENLLARRTNMKSTVILITSVQPRTKRIQYSEKKYGIYDHRAREDATMKKIVCLFYGSWCSQMRIFISSGERH